MAVNETARLLASLELQDKFTGPARTIGSSVDGLERRVGGLQSTFGRVQQGLGQMGRGAGQIGRGIDQIATRAIIAAAGLGTALITTAASFEVSEAGIRKTVEGTEAEVDALIDTVKQMSRTIPLSFEELAAIGAEGGALGIATGSLDEFIDVVARLGVSTDLTTDAAATALGHMANVLHLSDADLENFADSLVALGNKGASTESEILDLATRFGAAGKQAGLTNEAILALASTTSSMGIEAEAGGGALSRIFQGITLDIGTATEEGQVLAESMGLSLAELRTAWDNDAGAVFGELLGVLSELDKFEQAQFLSNLGITNVRDINALSLLSSGVEQYTEDLKTSTGQTNELQKESDAFFNTTAGKWQTFQNNVRLGLDVVGGKLLPVVNEVLGDLVTKLSDPQVQAGLEAFGTDLAEGVRGFIEEVKKADFGPLIGTLRGAADIARGAFDAFRALPQPIQQLALAAIVANKVTGGAVGSIAGGLANLLGGALKIAFLDRGTIGNPMWVRSVGGIGGGPGGGPSVSPFGGPNRNIPGLGLLPGLIAGAVGFEVGKWLATGRAPWDLPPTMRGPNALPRFDTGKEGSAGSSGFGVGALNDLIGKIKSLTTLPDTAVLNKDSFEVVLPDTAMTPVTDAIGDLTTVVKAKGPWGPLAPDESTMFPPTVKLDPSQVTDLREPTRLAWLALLDLKYGAVQADNAMRTAAAFQTTELGRVRSEVAAQGGRQLAKQDAIAAAVRDNSGILTSKDFSPKFSVTANVTTNVSISEIQRKVTSQAIALGLPVYRDANVR